MKKLRTVRVRWKRRDAVLAQWSEEFVIMVLKLIPGVMSQNSHFTIITEGEKGYVRSVREGVVRFDPWSASWR